MKVTAMNSPESIVDVPVVLIRMNRLHHDFMGALQLYEATRGVWKMGPRRYGALFAFAVFKGVVKEVYRIEFSARVAPQSVRQRYLGKSVKRYFQRGNSNPITYINC